MLNSNLKIIRKTGELVIIEGCYRINFILKTNEYMEIKHLLCLLYKLHQSISGLEKKSPEERNGNPLQYSCLENYMDRGAWQAMVHGATETDTTGHIWTHGLTKQLIWQRLSL